MKRLAVAVISTVILAINGCGGGGGSSSTTTTGTNSDGEILSSVSLGIAVPAEISAVPSSDTAGSSKPLTTFASALKHLAATSSELGATSDYAKANPSIYVEERALEQFDIIEQVFSALAQTNYADAENVNAGPYKTMIAWEEDQGGKDVKSMQTWTVESRMIVVSPLPSDVTGNTTGDTNRLMAWIPETDHDTGEEELVKAEFLIYTAPTKADDGSLLNYGEWDMNVLFAGSTTGVDTIPTGGPEDFFVASARIASNGASTLKVHEKFTETFGGPSSTPLTAEKKGILVRSGASGYGQVEYADFNACFSGGGGGTGPGPCDSGVPVLNAKYSYNDKYLGVQEIDGDDVAGAVVYKDRNLDGAIRIIHRYSLFHADADSANGIAEGDDAEKHTSFGFPVSYENSVTDPDTSETVTFDAFAFYGAWQGRHQLWGPGGITAAGGSGTATVLTRQDVRPGQTAPTYNLVEFDGSFTLRSLVDADLDDIKDIPVETWLNDHYDLFYSDTSSDFEFCAGYIDWSTGGPSTKPTCRDKATDADIGYTTLAGSDLLGQLSVGSGERRWVNIGGEIGGDPMNGTPGTFKQFVYLTSDPSVTGFTYTTAGFYEGEWNNSGGLSPIAGATVLVPTDGQPLWVDLGGSIYISYVGFGSGVTSTTTGWVQKTLTGFDEQSWIPTFSSSGDSEFTPDRGVEYYMNAQGQNFVVKRIGDATNSAAAYSAKLELQTAANPGNTDSEATTAKTILPAGTAYLSAPWNQDVKYTLVEAPSDSNYLLLTIAADASGNSTAGATSTDDAWGLVAYKDVNGDTNLTAGTGYDDDRPMASDGSVMIVDEWGWMDPALNSNKEPTQFNWEYAGSDGDSWGKQQFLKVVGGDFILLSDPISLAQVGLYDNLGNPVKVDPTGADVVVGTSEANWKKVSLQFDGWMHGLPDMYFELEKNSWDIAGMGEKVRRLLDGQMVTDGNSVNYFAKPMEMSLFLGTVSESSIIANPEGTVPDMDLANSPSDSTPGNIDLDTVPDYTAHDMGAAPTLQSDGTTPLEVKYSEGQPLAAE